MAVKKKKATFWEFFQGLGKTFMLPVALLAFMGILLGLGSSFSSESMIETIPFLGKPAVKIIFQFMSTIGGFAFAYLPVMFAMAIPLGLVRKEKGIAAFSGFVGYTVMNLAINFYLVQTNRLVDPEQLREAGQGMVFGIQTIEMGVLGGIIAGLIVYKLHNRFYTVQLLFWRTVCANYYFISNGIRGLSNSVSLATFRANDYGDWPTYPTFWYFWAFSVWFRGTSTVTVWVASYFGFHDSFY